MLNVKIEDLKLHECDELKVENKRIFDELFNQEDAEVSVHYDGKKWSILVPYWNDEYDQIETASSRIKHCPYCGKKL